MINANYFWTNVFFLASGTFLIRISIIAISGHVKISDRIREIFTFIPVAILPAFVAPSAFFHEGVVTWAYGKERLLILAAASVLCYFYRSTFATIAFGLTALYLMTHF